MRARIFYAAVTIFWVVMNYLLWTSEEGGRTGFGTSLPAQTVWDKILTAPDSSTLDIYDHDVKTGVGHWTAGLADSPLLSSKILSPDFRPGQTDMKPGGYTLSFEGNLLYKHTNHTRFLVAFALDTNKVWKDFRFRASMRPRSWDFHALSDAEMVSLKMDDGTGSFDRTWTFAELREPQSLFGDVGFTFALGVLGMNQSLPGVIGPGIKWDAHEDHLKINGSTMRAYRLDAYIMGQRIEIEVSLVGEILRVNLPRNISLRNQAVNPTAN